MKTVAVFFGGRSVEHDISVITGVLTLNSVNGEKYFSLPVYVDSDGTWYTGDILRDIDEFKNLDLKKLKKVTFVAGSNVLFEIKGRKLKEISRVSVAINCMHGERGEDGCLAGLLKTCDIAFASPDILCSAVSIDKRFTKIAMKGLRVKTLPCVTVKSVQDRGDIAKKIGFPVIVKPEYLGSSIGIATAENDEELVSALSYALRFGGSAVVEPCLKDFIEINCAAYADKNGKIKVSECERPIGRTEILSFNDKYESGKRIFPADIDKKISDKIKKITEKVYSELDAFGVIRIDYFVRGGEVFLNEINSVPGSLAYYLFGETLGSFSVMLDDLLCAAEEKHTRASNVLTEYKSGILFSGGFKGSKRLR